ncbi:MAG TPA: hypothetical protein VGL61_11795 [Kofleriaceae bacterium]|jgi:hypothetical protein
MKCWLCVLLALGSACGGNGEDAGARGDCAEGGALNGGTCPADPTPDGACTYLVECGVIPQESDQGGNHRYDWGDCVDTIQGFLDSGQQLAIECIEESTCDALKVPGSPDKPDDGDIQCLRLGGGGT